MTSAVAGLAAALLVAGCATRREDAPQPPWPGTPVAAVAHAEYPVGGRLEDDGLPAQEAPPRRERPAPDDPSEPYSPNYGRSPPLAGHAAAGGAVPSGADEAHAMQKGPSTAGRTLATVPTLGPQVPAGAARSGSGTRT
ncbi:MAG: hypothetical protein NW205_00815 [Hyphomicrobiaceae bacterium]|nr:hypothetical protein [Hyphomicrobiaceae bacterium]